MSEPAGQPGERDKPDKDAPELAITAEPAQPEWLARAIVRHQVGLGPGRRAGRRRMARSGDKRGRNRRPPRDLAFAMTTDTA